MADRDGAGPGEAEPRYRAVGPKELLPCPFCGSADVQSSCVTDSWFLIRCRGCGVEMENHDSTSAVVKLWNARPASPGDAADLAREVGTRPRTEVDDALSTLGAIVNALPDGPVRSAGQRALGALSVADSCLRFASQHADPSLPPGDAMLRLELTTVRMQRNSAHARAKEASEARATAEARAVAAERERDKAVVRAEEAEAQQMALEERLNLAHEQIAIAQGLMPVQTPAPVARKFPSTAAAALAPRPSGADPGRGTGQANKGEAR